MKLELRGYQRDAVAWIRERSRSALFLEMGLGKTAITLSALTPDMLPALVVAPKRPVTAVWPPEAKLWRPDLVVAVAQGSPAHRKDVLENFTSADIVVISRDLLADAVPYAAGYKTFVLDELSSFKSPTAKRTKAAIKIADKVKRVVGLTGTPAPNGYLDLWPELRIIDGGERLGKRIGQYRARYFTPKWPLPNGVIPGYNLRPGADRKIDAALSDICLSMGTPGRVSLPEVTFNRVDVEMTPRQRKAYASMRDTLVANIAGEDHLAANAGVLTGKLSQIAAGFLYRDDTGGEVVDWVSDAKLDALREVIEGTGSPVLVFHRFREEARRILEKIPGAERLTDASTIERWNRGKIPVLVAHPASAGHGLNLQAGGHTVVWTTLTWSAEEWLQANKRLHRSGQKHPVVVHDLRVPGTVDDVMHAVISGKKNVQQALLDYLER